MGLRVYDSRDWGEACFVPPVHFLDVRDPDVCKPGIYKTVMTRFWHLYDSQDQILAYIRQTGPDSGTYKTVKDRFWL